MVMGGVVFKLHNNTHCDDEGGGGDYNDRNSDFTNELILGL